MFEKEEKIRANIIFEMLGRPKEHLKEVMSQFLDALANEKAIDIKSKNVHEVKKIEEKDKDGKDINPEMYSTFSDLEIEFKNLIDLVIFSFKYMPAHIEIIYPEKFDMTHTDINIVINELLMRLHYYDSVAKSAILNNQALAEQINAFAQQANMQNKNGQNDANLKVVYQEKKEVKEKAKKKINKKKK